MVLGGTYNNLYIARALCLTVVLVKLILQSPANNFYYYINRGCVGLCTEKLQAVYENMLRAVLDACDKIGVSADPTSVTTDFEIAAMNAVRNKFGSSVSVHGCFFHLCGRVNHLGM